jgi:adenylate cyclase
VRGFPAFRTGQRVILPLVLFSAGLIAALYAVPATREFLDRRERLAMDETHQASRKTTPRTDLVVLGIDDASLKLDSAWPEDIEASPALQAMQKQWPWPRRAWASILDKLSEAGAKQVFLDITFKSPSEVPENDHILAEALQRHKGKVLLGMKFEDSPTSRSEDAATEFMLPTTAITGGESNPDNYGVLNFWPDDDGVIRAATWRTTISEAHELSAEVIAKARREKSDGKPLTIKNPDDRMLDSISTKLARALNADVAIPKAGTSRIRFSSRDAYPAVSLYQMFIPGMWEGNLANGTVFKDKTILIGAIASDLQDIQATPVGEMPGVNVHAQALTALLAGEFIKASPPWFRWAAIAAAALAAWLIVSLVRMPVASVGILLALGVSAQWLAVNAFDWFDREVSALPFTLSLGACGIAGITGTFLMQLRESRKLQRFLGRYTSPEFAEEMMSDRASLYTTLGGVERTVTVFFSDVRGFTSMSENMTPTEVVTQLNEYLSRMVERVFQHRGLVDKFIGDAVMALWGSTRAAPSEEGHKQDAINAVTASLTMRAALIELNASWRQRGIAELKIGMGVHQGNVIVGNIGSESPYEKMDLTVIGDAVNLASRLEGVTKEYGVDLIISEAVHRHVKDACVCRSADLVAVKGKAKPVEVFTVIGVAGVAPPAGLASFEAAMKLYREGRFTDALATFDQAASEGLDDKLTHVYQDRCRELIAHPPESWNGVFVMTKK